MEFVERNSATSVDVTPYVILQKYPRITEKVLKECPQTSSIQLRNSLRVIPYLKLQSTRAAP